MSNSLDCDPSQTATPYVNLTTQDGIDLLRRFPERHYILPILNDTDLFPNGYGSDSKTIAGMVYQRLPGYITDKVKNFEKCVIEILLAVRDNNIKGTSRTIVTYKNLKRKKVFGKHPNIYIFVK